MDSICCFQCVFTAFINYIKIYLLLKKKMLEVRSTFMGTDLPVLENAHKINCN